MCNNKYTELCVRSNEHFFAPYDVAKTFGRNQKNRPVQPNHVNHFVEELTKIKDTLEANHSLPAFNVIPIIVNGNTGNVLDGQHKLAAYLKAIEKGIIPSDIKICVGFYDCSEKEEPSIIIKLNEKSKNWSLVDFVGFYWYEGNENYRILTHFAKNHRMCRAPKVEEGEVEVDENTHWPKIQGLNLRYAACFLKLKNQNSNLKKGLFKVTEEDLKMGNIIYAEISEILHYVYGYEKVDESLESLISMWAEFRDCTTLKKVKSKLNNNKLKLIDRIKNGGKDAPLAWGSAFNGKKC